MALISGTIILCILLLSISPCKLYADQLDKLYNKRLDDVQEQLWLFGLSVASASYTWHDAVKFINHDSSAIKSWASDTTPVTYCSLIHKAPWGRVWSLSLFYNLNTLFVRDVVIPLFNENDYILIPFWGDVTGSAEYFKALLKNAQFPDNFYFLGNSDDCTSILRNSGLQAFTVSHNAFIDRETFRPISRKILYDAVYLGDCRPQKRLYLAKDILPDLLIVTHSLEEVIQPFYSAKCIMHNPPMPELVNFVNQAHCGLLLSAKEGGCYASTEYLYCGIPVVSTKSRGGRDAYYDDVTAIIVDDTPEDVRRGVEIMCERKSDPWEIRRRALAVSDEMLDTLANEIFLPIFLKYGDAHANNPRSFVDTKIKESKRISSKGRTIFQPENATHNRVRRFNSEVRH